MTIKTTEWANIKKVKFCPLQSGDCSEKKCAWWTYACTTEGGVERECAIKILAMQNSEGKIPL